MSYLAIRLAVVGLVSYSAFGQQREFYTGQAARMIIGQRTITEQSPNASATVLGGVGGLAFANNMLFVADSNRVSSTPLNHRVLVFRNIAADVLPVNGLIPQEGRCPACRGAADTVLGQEDFQKTDLKLVPTQASLRNPTAVASDGVRLAVADTDNNRVLIWNSIPNNNNRAADVVLGQENFTTASTPRGASGQRMRGPQGVWFQGNRFFVADSGNNRVMIWNSIPTRTFQSADIVLGQPDFNTVVELDLTRTAIDPKNNNLLNPVSVTSDGTRLFVSDLGQNRVLIWNSIPTQNQQAADLVLGQKDFTTAVANNSSVLCESNGKDKDGKDTFPATCLSTMDFPRYALSDGRRLFIADGGNDRVMVYNSMPVRNGQPADLLLGQTSATQNRSSDSAFPLYRASADLLRTPMSLAWDGTNLFVSDTFNRRISVFSLHDQPLPFTAVRNAASRDVFATGAITFDGVLKENDEVTVTVNSRTYAYKQKANDNFNVVINSLRDAINFDTAASVSAAYNPDLRLLLLTARRGGQEGNKIEYSVKTSDGATITATTAGAVLSGGQDAAQIAAGTIVTLLGDALAETTITLPADVQDLPRSLGGVRVYFDGIEAPLLMVSPGQVNAQVPWEVADATGSNAYLRIERRDGSVVTTSPVAVPIIPQNPGIFAYDGDDPRVGVATHFSDSATGTVSVDGTANAGDIATVSIEEREYSYTVKTGDTLATIRDEVIRRINANAEERVTAFPAGLFTRIRLKAKQPGPDGNGIKYTAKSNDGGQVIMTATTPALCCANRAGAFINRDNPALPGETIVLTATGLGRLKDPAAQEAVRTGLAYTGPELNEPFEFVSSLAGGKTANVLFAGLKPGFIGLYEVHLELNSDMPTNEFTQVTIAQDVYVSNVVTFALRNPNAEPQP